MAHELSMRKNGTAEMAYVGELPWHALGQEVTKGASLGVWAKEAGLDWQALEATAQYTDLSGVRQTYPQHKVLYRSDTGAPVGMVSDKYKTMQPAAVLEFFRDLTEAGSWHIHTAGVLRGGSKIWAMASNDIEGAVKGSKGKDQLKANLLLATSMDGSMKTTAKLTAVRVVCANTLGMALADGGDMVTVSHRRHFDAKDVKNSLGVAIDSFALLMYNAERMADSGIKTDEARLILRDLFGQPKLKDINAAAPDYQFQRLMSQFSPVQGLKEREQRSVTRCLSLFNGEALGYGLPGTKGTRWGLLNAVTQHVDHEMGRTDDTRMESAWFGRGEDIKTAAYEALAA